ncbi:MAG: acetyl-coenzyme A synthetase, partial [Mycetocola sp.]
NRALPGLSTLIVDEEGNTVPFGEGGYLVVDRPGPALARTVWGDPERYRDSYWSKFWKQGYFFSGDGAKWDADGDIWVLGRVDDVINVSGHRLSTIEIESALVAHPAVGEAGVVGVTDALTGQAIAAYVIPASRSFGPEAEHPQYWLDLRDELTARLRAHVATEIGPIAKPRDIIVVPDLPKTRSGKIMRRLLGDISAGRPLGDVTSLQDDTVPARIEQISRA